MHIVANAFVTLTLAVVLFHSWAASIALGTMSVLAKGRITQAQEGKLSEKVGSQFLKSIGATAWIGTVIALLWIY